MKKFLDCISVVGTTPSRFQGKRKYVSTGAVATTEINESEVVEVTYEDRPSRANLSAESGDILFAKMQGTRKTLLLDSETEENVYSTGFYAIRANPEVITTECLYYLVDSELFLTQKDKHCSGATQKAITNGGLAKIEIRVPPLSEQGILTEKLRNLTRLIADKRKQLELFDEVIKSRFIEMFGDPIRNTMGWPICELSECIQFLTSGSRGWAKYFTDEGEYFITIKNVKNCRITLDGVQHIIPPNNAEAKRTKVHEGDLLISITADLGRTGVVTKEIAEHGGYINQHLTCIRIDQEVARPLYVAYYMESEAGKCQFQSKNQSAVKAGLNFNAINSLRFMLPPIELQDRFIEFIEQTDKSKFEIQQSLEKLEILKKSLMQQYFG